MSSSLSPSSDKVAVLGVSSVIVIAAKEKNNLILMEIEKI